MKIAILGFAGQGQSAYRYWDKPENDITVCDSDANISVPKGAKSQLGKDSLKNLDQFDLLIRTPVIHPRQIQEANPETPDILDKVWTNTNEFFEVCPTENVIGVTGTKGKGTTSTLITRILDTAGFRVHLGGNIGTPPLDLLVDNIRKEDWVVLELANFQLIDLKSSPHIAVCLMIEPEHLNWHETIDEYVDTKRQLFVNQSEDDVAIYYADNNYSKAIAESSKGLTIPYMSAPGAYVMDNSAGEERIMIDGHVVCKTSEIQLLGKHNWQNVCAAVTAAWNITHDIGAIKKAITSFRGLPHRLEFVREVDGVRYFNDSFSSAPGATVAALDAIEGNKVLIVGGVDKGIDLDELARSMLIHKGDLRHIVIIGEISHKLEKELLAHGLNNYEILKNVKMPDIVGRARQVAHSGDSVLLSPGTSSFDMFKNFEDRGVKFKEAVNAL